MHISTTTLFSTIVIKTTTTATKKNLNKPEKPHDLAKVIETRDAGRYLYISMFTAALFTTAMMWKQLKCSTDDNKMDCSHTMELVIEKHKLPIHVNNMHVLGKHLAK